MPALESERVTSAGAGKHGARLGLSFFAQFLGALALVALLKFPTLHDPPMWDTAMGLFPAAIELSETGFDLRALLGAPGYAFGGPNTHATSIVTFITAAVLSLTPGHAFTVLHLMHFAVTALALVLLFRLVRPVLGGGAGAGLAGVAFLLPVFFVQAGRLYFEVPLFLCAVGMLGAHVKGRYLASVVWATLGFAVKETGIMLPGTLALLVLLEDGPWRQRLSRAVGAIGPSLVVLAVPVALAFRQMTDGTQTYYLFPPIAQVVGQMGQHLVRFLFRVPDVLLLLVLFLVSFGSQWSRVWRGLRSRAESDAPMGDEDYTIRLEASVALFVLVFLAMFFVVLPLVTNFTLVLPRYYTLVTPFLLIWMTLRVRESNSGRLVIPCLAAVLLFSVLNLGGRIYPPDTNTEGPGNDFALTERSMAYRGLNRIQHDAIRYIVNLPGRDPVFYGHHEHFLTQYPKLGYVDGRLETGRNIWLDRTWRATVAASDCVYAVFNYPWLGGAEIRTLVEELGPELGMVHDTARVFRHGRYAVTVHRLQASQGACAE